MSNFWDATRQQVIDDIQAMMEEHPDADWTMAAQAVAMNREIDERELLEDFREFFEGGNV